ncbi:MAG: mechanosensitive ion channel family protein [Firmicutes bacterium]|nr:mechanosensitive ion channel family protein [Bacillota bacterium]
MVINMKLLEKIFQIISKKEVYGLILIVVISYIIYNFGKLVISKVFTTGKNTYEVKKRKTVVSIIESLYKYFLLIIMAIFILKLYGIDVRSLVAGVGIAGALIGLALQDTLKDIISGISIIMENYYVVGDYIKLNDFTGQVIEFGLKSTKIRNFNGEVLVFANRNVEKVINISQKSAKLIVNIPTAYEEKAAKVEKILNNLIEELKKEKDIYENTKYLGISELGASEVMYTIQVECAQEKQWQIKRDVLRKIKDTYDKEKIKIPYKQIEVHHGQDI